MGDMATVGAAATERRRQREWAPPLIPTFDFPGGLPIDQNELNATGLRAWERQPTGVDFWDSEQNGKRRECICKESPKTPINLSLWF